jgi:hypothetical protein
VSHVRAIPMDDDACGTRQRMTHVDWVDAGQFGSDNHHCLHAEMLVAARPGGRVRAGRCAGPRKNGGNNELNRRVASAAPPVRHSIDALSLLARSARGLPELQRIDHLLTHAILDSLCNRGVPLPLVSDPQAYLLGALDAEIARRRHSP